MSSIQKLPNLTILYKNARTSIQSYTITNVLSMSVHVFYSNNKQANPLVLSIELFGRLSLHVSGVSPAVTIEGVCFRGMERQWLKPSLLFVVKILGLLKHEPN